MYVIKKVMGGVCMAGQMEILTREELEEAVLKRKPGERISFREQEFERDGILATWILRCPHFRM